jgi:hypothetical protein
MVFYLIFMNDPTQGSSEGDFKINNLVLIRPITKKQQIALNSDKNCTE